MLFTVNELAKQLNKNPETIRRYVRSKKLKATITSKKGGYMIEFDELENNEYFLRICNLDSRIKWLREELKKAEIEKNELKELLGI